MLADNTQILELYLKIDGSVRKKLRTLKILKQIYLKLFNKYAESDLIKEERARMKILLIDPHEDIFVERIERLLRAMTRLRQSFLIVKKSSPSRLSKMKAT
jgi:hypothetical protein